MNKKGLATLFIFLGMLLLFAIIVLVAIVTQEETTNTQTQQILTRSEMQPIQDYIETCLKLVSEEAVDLLGRQGFALYASQGGTIPGIDTNQEGKDFVIYGTDPVHFRVRLTPENTIVDNGKIILSNSKTKTEQYGDTTLLVYPWATYPQDPFTGQTTTYLSSGFGWNTLPPLNRIGPDSIEAQIEGYITKRMQDCTDFDNYPQFTITTGAINTQAIFANKNTIITLKWPLELRDELGRRGLLEAFIAKVPVRLATIHRFLTRTLDNDVSNITYDIRSEQTEFDVYLEEHPTGHSVVRVVDPLSILNGKPYEARIARENRPPALERINQDVLNTPTSDYLLGTCNGAIIKFDTNRLYVDNANSTCTTNINIMLRAQDPDEENVTFSVTARRGVPHTIDATDTLSPAACMPHTIIASDGTNTDTQLINLRLKSTQFAPQCVQSIAP